MSRRFYRFFKPSKISSDLICTICSEVFLDATTLPCEHTLCEECITRWSKRQHSCPLCRKSFKMSELKPAANIIEIVQSLDVVCKFPNCDWKGPLNELSSHEMACAFSPEKATKEVLELLPVYSKGGEEDIETPSSSLVTKLFKNYPDIITSVLIKAHKRESHEKSTVGKKRYSKKSIDPLQIKLDGFFNH
jgi:hypothetical protein